MSSKGRIELRVNQSRAKIDEEVVGDVRFCVAPQKTGKSSQKRINRTLFQNFFEKLFEKCVFGDFRSFFEELRKNGRHQQLPRHFLL